VSEGTVNSNLEEDPYNLEEIASQLIDDDEPRKQTQGTSGSQKTQTYELDLKDESPERKQIANHTSSPRERTDSNKDAREEMESKGANDDDDNILYELGNSELCLSDDGDSIEKEISSIKFFSVDADCVDSPMTSVARKCVSFKLSPNSDEEERDSNKLTNNFTRLKEKPSASFMSSSGSFSEESCDVIPPTSSLNGAVKSRIARKVYVEDSDGQSASSEKEDQSFDLSNSSEKSSSSEDDSDEGLFSRRKQSQPVFRKRKKPVTIPFSEARAAAFKAGQRRFRRFPGKKTQDIDVKSKSVTAAKRSRKETTVEEIFESCGVHYTHANRHIVGPSEAENHMSKQALQDVFELRQFSQQPANCFPALETSDESDDLGESAQDKKPEVTRRTDQPEAGSSRVDKPPLRSSAKTSNDVTVERLGNSAIFIGSTPRGIRRQHFREMSDALGFSSEIDLAKAVVNGNESDRREMLKRYYVDKNPVLSGLSSFSDKPSGENMNEKQVVGNEKNSLERKRRDYSSETAKKSKRNMPKRKSKTKSYGRDQCCEQSFERHEMKDLVSERNSRSKKPRCRATALEGKHKVQRESFEDDSAMKEEKVNSEVKRNCGLEEAGTSHFHQTNQLEQNDVKTKSKTSKANEDSVAETQGCCLESTSELSVSIFDEFLLSDPSRRSAEIENSGRRVNKWKQRNSQKEGKQLDKTKEKETIQGKKNPTSVLDEFI